MNLTQTLKAAGYNHSNTDPLVFSKWDEDDFITLSVHEYDLYAISSQKDGLESAYKTLTDTYNDVTRKEGDLLTYLRVAITHDSDNGTVTVSQPAYIEKMLVMAGMHECKTNYLHLVGIDQLPVFIFET